MGRLLQSIFICGQSYQKFNDEENNEEGRENMAANAAEKYKCERCGHHGLIKKTTNDILEQENKKVLNNCKNAEHHQKTDNLRLVNNNLGRTSWTRRNLLMQQRSLKEKCNDHQLMASPWFQEGLSRDITTEILSDRPAGSFLVRGSVSRPDSFALSLRVPNDGIAHYLIHTVCQNDQTLFRIKGSTKTFGSLVSLVIHHSVMAENLPCPLLIDHGSWISNERKNGLDGLDDDEGQRDNDFADTDLDDYSNLVMTLRKSISSSTSDISSLTSLD